jgi:DNA-binding transcriptional ArsR family regulator
MSAQIRNIRMMTDTLIATPAPSPDEIAELQASAIQASRLMKLLASEQRLVLLCALLEKECSVGELARGAGLSQTTASQHLAKLRAERIVETRRDAQTIYYRLDDPNAVKILHALCEVYKPKR